MNCASLHEYHARVGNAASIRLFADDQWLIPGKALFRFDDDMSGHAGVREIRLFVVGGAEADAAPAVHMPPDALPLVVTGDVSIVESEGTEHGDWFGKARSVADAVSGTSVLLVPGSMLYNPLFLMHRVVRPLIDRLLFECGLLLLHGACAARDGRAVIVAGNAGCGKSTLLRGLLDSGFTFLGDDRVAVSFSQGRCTVQRFPEYVRLGGNITEPKQVSDPGVGEPSAAASCVVLLSGAGGDGPGEVLNIGPAEAAGRLMNRLAPFLDARQRKRAFGMTGDLVASSRVFRVKGSMSPSRLLDSVVSVFSRTVE